MQWLAAAIERVAAVADASPVLSLGVLLLCGYFAGRLAGLIRLPSITGYIVAGLALVLLFSVILAMVTPLFGVAGAHHGAVLHAVAEAGTEIGLSVLVGAAGSVFLHFVARRSPSDGARLVITVAVVFVVTAGALALELSPLLANMAFGALLINLSPSNRQLFMVLEPVTPPIFALFFILAGAELQLSVFAEVSVVILGLAYLAARFAGKFTGAYVGARVMGAPAAVRRYLGFCLFPQAGVAIGLALFLRGSSVVATAGADVQRLVTQLVNIVLLSVFINELIGPLISRFGVTRGVAAQR